MLQESQVAANATALIYRVHGRFSIQLSQLMHKSCCCALPQPAGLMVHGISAKVNPSRRYREYLYLSERYLEFSSLGHKHWNYTFCFTLASHQDYHVIYISHISLHSAFLHHEVVEYRKIEVTDVLRRERTY